MDPFSLSVGILTIIAAVSTSIKSLDHALHAERELSSFITELEGIKSVVEEIKAYPASLSSNPLLAASLSRAKVRIEESHDIVTRYRWPSGQIPKRRSIDPITWIRKRSKVQRSCDGLKASRAELTTSLQLLNTYVALCYLAHAGGGPNTHWTIL